jgi:hypothetical protein
MPTSPFPATTPSAQLWHVLYQEAIVEFDDAKLTERISRARDAIRDKAQESVTNRSEHERLDNALQTLQILEEIAGKSA